MRPDSRCVTPHQQYHTNQNLYEDVRSCSADRYRHDAPAERRIDPLSMSLTASSALGNTLLLPLILTLGAVSARVWISCSACASGAEVAAASRMRVLVYSKRVERPASAARLGAPAISELEAKRLLERARAAAAMAKSKLHKQEDESKALGDSSYPRGRPCRAAPSSSALEERPAMPSSSST